MASPSSHAKDASRQGWTDVKGAAAYLTTSTAFIYSNINTGELPAIRMSSAKSPFRIRYTDLDAFMASMTEAGVER